MSRQLTNLVRALAIHPELRCRYGLTDQHYKGNTITPEGRSLLQRVLQTPARPVQPAWQANGRGRIKRYR